MKHFKPSIDAMSILVYTYMYMCESADGELVMSPAGKLMAHVA